MKSRIRQLITFVVLMICGAQLANASLNGDQVNVSIFVSSGTGTIVVGPAATVGPGNEFVVTQTLGASLLVTHNIDFSDNAMDIVTTSSGTGGGSGSIRFTFTSVDTGAAITGFQQVAGLNLVLNQSHTSNSIIFDLGFSTNPANSRTTSISLLPSQATALTELDLFTPGDSLLTRDGDTGLDWLDVSATSGLSFNDIIADVDGWASLGFRHATGSELCAFLAAHAVVPASGCPTGNVAVSDRFLGSLHTLVESFARSSAQLRAPSAVAIRPFKTTTLRLKVGLTTSWERHLLDRQRSFIRCLVFKRVWVFAPRPLRNHSVSRSTEIGWYVKFQLTKTAMGYPTLTTTVRQPQIRIRRTGTAMVREMRVTRTMTMMALPMEWTIVHWSPTRARATGTATV